MEELVGRSRWRKLQVDVGQRMALIRADTKAVLAERKTLFVACDNDFVEEFQGDRRPVFVGVLDQCTDFKPAFLVKLHPDGLRLVPEDEAKELAGFDDVRFQIDRGLQQKVFMRTRQTTLECQTA